METHLLISKLTFTLLILSVTFTVANSDLDQDIEECKGLLLLNLWPCLTYVKGDSKAPTRDCCNGLRGLMKINEKCLCVVLLKPKDSGIDLGINATIAKGLPKVCHVQADISKCPDLLHMDPDSPEAEVFKPSEPHSNSTAKSPASSPSKSPTISPSKSPSQSPGPSPSSNGEAESGKKWMRLEVIIVGLLLGFFHFKSI